VSTRRFVGIAAGAGTGSTLLPEVSNYDSKCD